MLDVASEMRVGHRHNTSMHFLGDHQRFVKNMKGGRGERTIVDLAADVDVPLGPRRPDCIFAEPHLTIRRKGDLRLDGRGG